MSISIQINNTRQSTLGHPNQLSNQYSSSSQQL